MLGLVVSGHRDLLPQDHEVIYRGMKEFLDYNEFGEILFGGARGTDTVALEAALKLRNEIPVSPRSIFPRLIVVVPDTLSKQPVETYHISQMADLVIELKKTITPVDNFNAIHHRNQFMVDWIAPEGRLLAFTSGRRSGTMNTMQYAASQGVGVSQRKVGQHGS